jgi:hypothetical protein
MDKVSRDLLALGMKYYKLVTELLTGHCTLWCHLHIQASWKAPCTGNVDRRKYLPTMYFVDAQLWLGREQKS